jgi:hypothetical protein
MKKVKNVLKWVIPVLLTAVHMSSCSIPEPGPDAFVQTVGPAGGTVIDPDGTIINIPAGALSTDTDIMIKTYENGLSFPPSLGFIPFPLGAELGPDGTTFAVPVTVSMAAAVGIEEGAPYSVFYWDPAAGANAGAWVEHPEPGIAGAGGLTFSTSHFSTWASSTLPGGFLHSFGTNLESTGSPSAAFGALKTSVTQSGLIGKRETVNGKEYEVVSVYLDVMGLYQETEFQYLDYVPVGAESGLEYDRVSTLSAYDDFLTAVGDEEFQNVWQVLATVYWKEVDEIRNWKGSMIFTHHFSTAIPVIDVQYQVDFSFTTTEEYLWEDSLYRNVSGNATATQAVTVISASQHFWIGDIDAPPSLNLVIEGHTRDGYLTIWLALSSLEYSLDPFFSFEVCDEDECEWEEGLFYMALGQDHVEGTPVPLRSGTFMGEKTYPNMDYLDTWIITLEPDE